MGVGSIKAACLAAALLLLAGCGGGGSGAPAAPAASGADSPAGGSNPDGTSSTSGGSTPAPAESPPSGASWLSFDPGRITLEAAAGTAPVFSVLATSSKLIQERINIAIVDNGGVLDPQGTSIAALSSTQYRASFRLSPLLAAKTYESTLTVKLCLDSPLTCANPYPGSPWTVPYTIAVKSKVGAVTTSAPMGFSYTQSQGSAQLVTVNVDGSGQQWSVASAPSWVVLDRVSGALPARIAVGVRAGQAAGRYADDIVLAVAGSGKIAIPVTLQVDAPASVPAPSPAPTPAPGSTGTPTTPAAGTWSLDVPALAFSAINGTPIGTRQLTISAAGTQDWTATTTAPWLTLSKSGYILSAVADPRVGSLASGNYTATINLNSSALGGRTIPVSLSLMPPTITASAETVLLGGSRGRDFSSRNLSFSLNTAGVGYTWQLSPMPGWTTATAASSLITQTSVSFVITPVPTVPGTQTGQMVISASVNGDRVTKTVTLAASIDQQKLLFSELGVALTATPQWSRLSRNLKVSNNFGRQTAWTAQSSQSWLTVTSSGTTDANGNSALSIQADPASLPADTISMATVTLTPQGTGVVAPEQLVVGLWKGSSTPTQMLKLPVAYRFLAPDPVRPLVYAHNGGSTVDVYNVYQQAKVATISGIGAALGPMAVSANGAQLFAVDPVNRALGVADLASRSAQPALPLASAVSASTGLAYARPNGVGTILVGDFGAYTLSPWQLAQAGSDWYPNVSVAPLADGSRVVYGGNSLSPSAPSLYAIDHYAGKFVSTRIEGGLGSTEVSSNGKEGAISADGSRFYSASGAPYQCMVWSGGDGGYVGMLPGAGPYPNNVKVGSDGRIFCGIFGWYSAADVWMYGPAGDLRATYKFAGYAKALLDRQFVVSGDGLVGIALTDDPLLAFIPIGP